MNRNPGSVWPAIRVAESDAFFLKARLAMGIGPCCDSLGERAMVFGHDPGPSPKSVAKSPETEQGQRQNTAGGHGKGADDAATGKDRLPGLLIGAGSGATNCGGDGARIRHTDLVHLGSSTILLPVRDTGSSAFFCSTSI